LVRHHRRGDPKVSEPRFAALASNDRDRVRKLAAILRVADGLDRGRRGAIADLRTDIGTDLVILRLSAIGDAELSLWGARRRRELFEQVFDREIEFALSATQNV
jgi:exopolyphosphatase/guanosine-5'-triphosphate,3'-diphosphate pyrophosphatase